MSDKELEGKMDKAKGKAKEKYGEVANDREAKAEGQKDQAKGEAKEAYGEAKRKTKDALD
jgi:uncharacterized protein YjbJ (UPF0337 family)